MRALKWWTGIAVGNLALVASLGVLLRCKILFPLPFIHFKNLLHAHSHFAFGGWVTIALLALLTYQVLPRRESRKPVYTWLLTGILVSSYGMLLSFPFQGYGAVSISFSTLFVFVSYAFTFYFTRSILRSDVSASVKLLSVGALIYMSLSSVGPFTLAYLMATHSTEIYLPKDAIYTYLHLQYSGFFTLSVFALLIHKMGESKSIHRFARLLNLSVIPTMFISYLWHYGQGIVWAIAFFGVVLTVLVLFVFFRMLPEWLSYFRSLRREVRILGLVALCAFVLKMVFQSLTIIPALGNTVFANRPVIVGFLHLVLLGFISLYLLSHLFESQLLRTTGVSLSGVHVFLCGVVINELILFAQGLGLMLMRASSLTNWGLLGAALMLLSGAVLIVVGQWKFSFVWNRSGRVPVTVQAVR